MTCYKVQAKDRKMYEKIQKLLRGRVTIFTADEKAFIFSVSEPSCELMDTLRQLGANVAVDYHYEFE